MNINNYKKDIGRCVSFLLKKDIKDIEIFTENTHEFIVVFFASLSLGLKPKILMDKLEDSKFNEFFSNIGRYEFREFSIDENSEFFLKTSGSSGISKDILKTFKQMRDEAVFLSTMFEYGDEFLASVSHQHMFGLTFKIFLPLVLDRKTDPEFLNYPEFIFNKDLQNKTLISSPTILNTLIGHSKKDELKKLKNIICAGGFLNRDIQEKIRAYTKLINIYGSTETGVVAIDDGDGFKIPDCIDFRKDERETLFVSSPWCKEFQTNDIVDIKDRKIELLGRFDRTIKLNEKRINLDILEKKIKSHEFVHDCISGVLNDKSRISIGIVLSKIGQEKFRNSGKKAIVDALKIFLKQKYQNSIRHVKILSNIKRNNQGKFKKSDFEKTMNLKEVFKFETISISQNRASFKSKVEFGLFYFSGHFMDFPLVPGFVQLECIVELAKKLNLNLQNSTKFEAIKFNGFLRPGDGVNFELEIKNNKLYFIIKNDEKTCASGRICIN